MKKYKNYYKLCTKLSQNSEAWCDAFRANLFVLLEEPGVTIQKLSEAAGVSYDTMRSFLYTDRNNFKLGSAVNIALSFGLSIDELVGAGTITDRERLIIQSMRTLPDAVCYYYEWAFKAMVRRCEGLRPESKVVPYLLPSLLPDGNVKPANVTEVYDISMLSDALRSKVKMALQLPCDSYMPKYSPYDILFIANDRLPRSSEDAVIIYNGFLWLCNINGDEVLSIRDRSFRCCLDSVEELVGYIAAVNRLEYL